MRTAWWVAVALMLAGLCLSTASTGLVSQVSYNGVTVLVLLSVACGIMSGVIMLTLTALNCCSRVRRWLRGTKS